VPEPIQLPPVGFVVEGDGEYQSYPSLAAKLLDGGYHFPIANAGGYGNLIGRVGEQLTDLCRRYSPYTAIVTIDAVDSVKDGLFPNCAALREALDAEVAQWLASAADDGRITLVPQRVAVVVQVPKFEGWIACDCESLVTADLMEPAVLAEPRWCESDGGNPDRLLRTYFMPGVTVKSPAKAKQIVSALDLHRVRAASRSFDKFARELTACFSVWKQAVGL
jgi:hypothetical protein